MISVFPADILGQVYEQFLGKVIRLTAGHQAKVEDKPEVKKAGGVYYTPTYIVDYIVKNTVGKLLGTDSTGRGGSRTRPKTGKGSKKTSALSPKEVSKLRILDPACGSGSFLLGAYQYLLDWHRDWYTTDGPEKWAKKRTPRVYQGPGGDWRLTTAERKRILLNNIYGVDIDPQAVEVTKLSLLLKVLEGESSETIGRTLELFHERALPDLGNNIKCGNSLIGPDFFRQGAAAPCLPPSAAAPCLYGNQQMTMFDEEERYRINAFDWNAEFPEIMCGAAEDLWFVTFVTHNSRVSERMVRFGVTDAQGKGLQPLVLTSEEQVAVAESLFDTARRHGFAFVALNVLPDHVHAMLPAADQKTLAARVRMLKTFSAQAINQRRQRAKGAHVWAQKFNRKHVETENDAARIYDYINQNQLKHLESWGDTIIQTWDKGLQPLARRHCVTPGTVPVATRSGQGAAAPCLPPGTGPVAIRSGQGAAAPCLPTGAGFDIVIGNPPYGSPLTEGELAYLSTAFEVFKGMPDAYVAFTEQAHNLLTEHGRFGYIIPSAWLGGPRYRPLREFLLNQQVETIIALPFDVFSDAYIDTVLITTTKRSPASKHQVTAYEYPKKARVTSIDLSTLPVSRIEQGRWSRTKDAKFILATGMLDIVEAIYTRVGSCLGDVAEMKRGVLFDKALLTPTKTSAQSFRYFEGNVYRYRTDYVARRWVQYGPKMKEWPKDFSWFEGERILLRRLVNRQQRLMASVSDETVITSKNLYVLRSTSRESNLYLLGILNSTLFSRIYLSQVSQATKDDFPQLTIRDLKALPLRTIDLDDASDAARHDRMVKLVDRMLSLHKQLAAARTAHDKTVLQRQIDTTDRQIDQFVYELYDLTDDEIAIVEETANA